VYPAGDKNSHKLCRTTPQGLELQLELYGKKEQVLLLEVPTPKRPELYMDMSIHSGA
jgi:hypothetical protein